MPQDTPPLRLLGCLWLTADQLTEPHTTESGTIHFGSDDINMAFADLDTLEAVIRKLTEGYYVAVRAQRSAVTS